MCTRRPARNTSGIIENLYDLYLGKSVDKLKPFFIYTYHRILRAGMGFRDHIIQLPNFIYEKNRRELK